MLTIPNVLPGDPVKEALFLPRPHLVVADVVPVMVRVGHPAVKKRNCPIVAGGSI